MEEKVIYENGDTKLSYKNGAGELLHRGKSYTFGCHPYEPMAIILEEGRPVAYIHNAFDPDVECKNFVNDDKYLVHTITNHYHNAEHFCRLLALATGCGCDRQIDELEKEMFMQVRWENHEVFYKTDDIEFGRYGDEPEDDEDPDEWDEMDAPVFLEHPEYEILYVIIDGVKYILYADWETTLSIKDANKSGKKAIVARIHQFDGIPEAYPGKWRSGELFSLVGGGVKYNTEIFCKLLAYAVRTGKKDYNLREIEKAIL